MSKFVAKHELTAKFMCKFCKKFIVASRSSKAVHTTIGECPHCSRPFKFVYTNEEAW